MNKGIVFINMSNTIRESFYATILTLKLFDLPLPQLQFGIRDIINDYSYLLLDTVAFNTFNKLWSRSYNMGKRWQETEITFYPDSSAKTYSVVFEASKGAGYRGDIALDDIKVTDGVCSNNSEWMD